MDPLKKLEGRSWKEWRALVNVLNDLDCAQSDESYPTQDSCFVKLPRSDMNIYGLCPGKEIFELVECSLCQKKIKMPVLFNHIKGSHPSQMETPAREETQQVEHKIETMVINGKDHDMQPFIKLLRLPLVAMVSTTDDGDVNKQFNYKRKEDSAQPPLTFHDSNSILQKLLSVQLPLVENCPKAFKRCHSFKENSLKSSGCHEDKIHKMCGFGLWQPGFRRAGGLLLASPHFPSLKSTSATQLKMSDPTINFKSHTQNKNIIDLIKKIKKISNVQLEPRKTLTICNRLNRKLIRGFPKAREGMKMSMTQAVRRENWSPNNYSFVCSDHFSSDQINSTHPSGLRLRENAVPNIFPSYPEYLKPNLKP